MKFVDLPMERRTKRDWDAIAAELKTRPGDWALILENVSSSTASQINMGAYRALRPVGAFEATTRENGYAHGRVDLYARFVGGEE